MKNYHLVSERHQCPESFQEVMKIVQKSEFAGVIYFQIRMRKTQKCVRIPFYEHAVLKELCKKVVNKLYALTRIIPKYSVTNVPHHRKENCTPCISNNTKFLLQINN